MECIKRVCSWLFGYRSPEEDIRIGSFNIQHFSKKKFGDSVVLSYILKIVSRYHLVLVQEVHGDEWIPEFVAKLNQFSGQEYKYVVSDSLGRKTYTEKYLYLYRSDVFSIGEEYHYDDGSEESGLDTFMREPYIVLVKSNTAPVANFAVIGAHIQPDTVAEELTELVKVHDNVIEKWGRIPVVMMGDFNAGRGYLSKKKMSSLELRTDERFHWLISDDVDTTVHGNTYSHDRIIATGDVLLNCVQPDSPQAFNFDEEYELSREEALKVSDHYPVEFVIGHSVKMKVE